MTRIDKLRQLMDELGVQAFLITNPDNLFYYANFTGSAGMALVTQETNYFVTDFRYTQQAKEQAQGYEVIIHKEGAYQEIGRLIAQAGLEKVAFEADHLTAADYLTIKENYEAELVATSNRLRELRGIKDADEIARIKEACRIVEDAFEHIQGFIKAGVTEIEVANELERFCKSQGSSGMSFDTIVASGYRSAMPHGVASDKVIEEGDMVTLDFGCFYKGYTSDLTRTLAVGEPDPQLKEIYAIVQEANRRVTEAAKPGITGAELDAVARDYITEAGYGPEFGHTTGHGIGIEVHELPAVAGRNKETLTANQVITNEPGIYVEGLGGVRIEDDILITEDGHELLTHSPRDLIIL